MPFHFLGRIDRPWRLVSILIVLLLLALFYYDWRVFQTATVDAERTRETLAATQAVLASVTDAETAQRGYLLTGDRNYLIPFESAEANLPRELQDLEAAVTARHSYVQEAARVESLTREKLAEMKETISVRDLKGAEAALSIVRTDIGQKTMAEIRSICSRIENGEYDRLFEHTRSAEHHASRLRWIVLVGCLALVALLFRVGKAVDTVVGDREKFAKTAEDARQELQTTLASIGDAVIATDAAGAVRFMNPVAEQLTGWTSSEALEKPLDNVFRIVHESTRASVESPVTKVLRDGVIAGLANHTVLLAKDGREVPIDDSGAPILDRRGAVQGVVLVFRDISERRGAERELERWKQLFVHAGFGMFMVNPHTGRIEELNQAFAKLHGYTVDELRGALLTDLASPESRQRVSAAIALASGKSSDLLETMQLRRDGVAFVCRMDITALEDEGGNLVYIAGYCSDITEHKQFEDTLRESEERFRTLAGALPQMIWSSKPDGSIEYVNPLWRTYAGWSEEIAPPGDPWSGLLHPDDRDDYLKRWNDCVATGNPFESQARLRRSSDGSYRWFLCRGVALRNREGKVIRWLGGCTEVQDQMETALQLKAANEALRLSNADLEQFAYAASHDLQEPLRMVTIYSQLLKEELGDKLDENAKAYINFAVNGARRMEILLKDLLAYSRVTNTAAGDGPVRADAGAAIKEALLNLTAAIDAHQAQVSVQSGLPVVRIPPIHLVQIFQNLIGNAIKYRKPDSAGEPPAIQIAASRQARDRWIFSVHDNGIGIDPQYLAQIFGVFKRLHGQEVEGTGIGLALCQKIVERAGGRIWAESELGKGSTFFFTLPPEGR